MRLVRRLVALGALIAVAAAAGAITLTAGEEGSGERRPAERERAAAAAKAATPARGDDSGPRRHARDRRERPREQIRWRRSRAVGDPAAGRLVHGVRLPAQGAHFFTWDPVLRRSPNRPWRRHGTDRLVRVLLRVAQEFGRAHPDAARMAIGDLSRPQGGDFGPQFGYIGHASHQNGLDADVYYPRADGRERAAKGASQIDRRLSQELVDRFVAAGASVVFVGPGTGLRGPGDRVQVLANHDNHLHLRVR